MRISDWSSDVCSSDLVQIAMVELAQHPHRPDGAEAASDIGPEVGRDIAGDVGAEAVDIRSEEHTSELQSLMRISYAVFCLKKKKLGDIVKQQIITAINTSRSNNHNTHTQVKQC